MYPYMTPTKLLNQTSAKVSLGFMWMYYLQKGTEIYITKENLCINYIQLFVVHI